MEVENLLTLDINLIDRSILVEELELIRKQAEDAQKHLVVYS